MGNKYQQGDWVIHNYQIKQITRLEDGKVREVSCGSFSTSSSDLTYSVRPLTLKNKRYAESIRYYYDTIHKLPGSNALNWPDINCYLEELCLKAIDCKIEKYKEGEMNPFLEQAQDFVCKTRDALNSVTSVDGVRLFRR